MHALPPSVGKVETLSSPYAKICFAGRSWLFTEPPVSSLARVKQRSLENHRTNKPKQPTESKARKGPQLRAEPTSSQPGCPSPALHSPDDARGDSSVFSLLASAAAWLGRVRLKNPSRELVSSLHLPPIRSFLKLLTST